jgi:flavin-dependent dehydrogenase
MAARTTRIEHDVIVVGGGPAGSSTAFQLARRGIRVVVLERSRFPRSKPCAECLSPQASRILDAMGVLNTIEARGATLRGMIIRAPNGTVIRGDYLASHGFRAFRDRGIAARREILDHALIEAALGAGAALETRARVTGVVRSASGAVRGVSVLRDGIPGELRAKLVIGADGLRSVVAQRLGLARSAAWPRRISLVAHYHGVGGVDDYGEMHVEADGFVGIADVGDGVTTVAAVFPRHRAKEIAGDRAGFLMRWLRSKPHLRDRFARSTEVGTTHAVGPFASHARRAWAPGALLVGDAADFFDPFTGEGIYAGLRGGELVADATARWLGASDARAALGVLRDYERARRREFGGKWTVERMIGTSVASPFLVNRASRALAADKRLADLLVGVTGDFVPPHQVLRVSYLARLFLLPVPSPAPDLSWQ